MAKAAARAMVAAKMVEPVASVVVSAAASTAASAAASAASVAEGRVAAARVREDADLVAVVAERAEVTLEMVVEAATVQIAVGMTGAMEKEVL